MHIGNGKVESNDQDKVCPKSDLYTKYGDEGQSMLYTLEPRSKSDITFAALGDVDEINATLGLAAHHCRLEQNGLEDTIVEIQCCLIEIGSNLGTPRINEAVSAKLFWKFLCP